jgi:hydrogenase maturation protease
LSKKIAVIGLGNTLRRDDGIGLVVLESLLKFYRRKAIDYLNFGSASFDLLNQIKNYERVLFIDGINADLAVGEVKIFRPQDIKYNLKSTLASTHELNLKNIFELSKRLGLKTAVYVAGIQIRDTSYGEGLTGVLAKRKKAIVKKISVFIDKTLV